MHEHKKNTRTIKTIDFLGSEGLEISLKHDGTRFYSVVSQFNGDNQIVFTPPNAEKYLASINNPQRLTHPVKRIDDNFVEISFQEAFDMIENSVNQVKPYENAFFAGSRLSNEELYLIQKLARCGVKSNNIGSFHYLKRDSRIYNLDKNDNVQLFEIEESNTLFLIGNVLNDYNLLTQELVQKTHLSKNIPTILISNQDMIKMQRYIDELFSVKSYYYLFKSLNHYILSNNLQYGIFTEALSAELNAYADLLLQEDFDDLLVKAHISSEKLSDLAVRYLSDKSCIIIYSEDETTEHTVREILNLCLLTEKLGFPYSGVLGLKEKNNAQGLFDMGINSRYGVGFRDFSADYINLLEKTWNMTDIATQYMNVYRNLIDGTSKNVFIFGEDPIGCAKNTEEKNLLKNAQFIVVQDYFLTDTAKIADVILPATFSFETGGSFTSATKIVQTFSKEVDAPIALNSIEQLLKLSERFGLQPCKTPDLLLLEFGTLFQSGCSGGSRHQFVYTKYDSEPALFMGGCDVLMK